MPRWNVFLFAALAWLSTAGLAGADPGADGQDLPAEDELLSDYIIDFPEEVVYARRETASTRVVLHREDIEASGAFTLAGLLSSRLGIQLSSYGGPGALVQANLRGVGGSRVAVFVDGIPVNSTQSGGFDLGGVNIDALERVELSYGGSDSLAAGAGAAGGSINLVTRTDSPKGLRVGFRLANVSYLPLSSAARSGGPAAPNWLALADAQEASAWLGFGGESGSVVSTFKVARASNEFNFIYEDGSRRTRSSAELLELFADLGARLLPADGFGVEARGSFHAARKGVPGPVDAGSPGIQEEIVGRASLSAELDEFPRDDSVSSLNAAYVFSRIDWLDAAGSARHDSHTIDFLASGAFSLDGWRARLALEAQFARLDSTRIGKVDLLRPAAEASAEARILDGLRVFPYLKLNVSEAGIAAVPKIGFVWLAGESLTLKQSAFRTYRAPTANDLYWPEDAFARGNPSLRPEDGWGIELSALWKPVDAGTGAVSMEEASLALFADYMLDLIQWRPAGGKWSPENTGAALLGGAHARVAARLSPSARARAEYEYLPGVLLDGGQGLALGLRLADGRRIPGRPEHRATLALEGSLEGPAGALAYGMALRFESGRYVSASNVARLPAYLVLDGSLSFKPSVSASYSLTALNLLNATYYTMQGYPMPGLSVRLAVSVTPK